MAGDRDKLELIFVTLADAVAEARTMAAEETVAPDFRELVRQAREMHDILLEVLMQAEPCVAELHGGRTAALDSAVTRLEELAASHDGKPH
jgi:hypothetical protein